MPGSPLSGEDLMGRTAARSRSWTCPVACMALVMIVTSCASSPSPSPVLATPQSLSAAPTPTFTAPSQSHVTASARVTCEDKPAGTIWTVAGTRDYDTGGEQDAGQGDGGPATLAQLDGPYEVLLDAEANVFIAEDGFHDDWNLGRVRVVDADGAIRTVVGPPTPGGDAAPGEAGSIEMFAPWGMAFDPSGVLYVQAFTLPTDPVQVGRVYRVESTGDLTAVIQWPPDGPIGDDSPVEADFATVRDLYFDAAGTLYISDIEYKRVWAMDPGGALRPFAGSGVEGYSGDGGPAVDARLMDPERVASDAHGNIFITDGGAEGWGYVRKVDRDGIIHTVAGGGVANPGDGGPATEAALMHPFGVTVAEDGSLYITEAGGQRIRKVDPEGIITTVAGVGIPTDWGIPYGDGGPATEASFGVEGPSSITIGPDGNLYAADWENARIRMICL